MAPQQLEDPPARGVREGAPSLGNLEVMLKFANYAFEQYGLLLSYGVEFGVPTGDPPGALAATICGRRLQVLAEITGEAVLSGEEAGESLLLLAPGVKVAPMVGTPRFIGLGASVPFTEEELDVAARVSMFYHF